MITIVTIHEPGVRDHEGVFHKPFAPFMTTSQQFAALARRMSRSVYELDAFLALVDSPRTHEGTLRQCARNAKLDATGPLDAVRERLRALLAGKAPAEVKAPPAPEPEEPPAPPVPEPLVAPEHYSDEAWGRLKTAWDAQDYKAARSALAGLSDDPTPSKAADLWEAVELMLVERGLLDGAAS